MKYTYLHSNKLYCVPLYYNYSGYYRVQFRQFCTKTCRQTKHIDAAAIPHLVPRTQYLVLSTWYLVLGQR